jgi:hypothetical protein
MSKNSIIVLIYHRHKLLDLSLRRVDCDREIPSEKPRVVKEIIKLGDEEEMLKPMSILLYSARFSLIYLLTCHLIEPVCSWLFFCFVVYFYAIG